MKRNDEEEKFYYCKRCLSLDIRVENENNITYCNNCGSTKIEESDNMDDWLDMYNREYMDDPNQKEYRYSNGKIYKK